VNRWVETVDGDHPDFEGSPRPGLIVLMFLVLLFVLLGALLFAGSRIF
jgi:hypothetical protein